MPVHLIIPFRCPYEVAIECHHKKYTMNIIELVRYVRSVNPDFG